MNVSVPFFQCISENVDYSIPIGILFALSVISNCYLAIRVNCRKNLLEEDLELVSVFKKETQKNDLNV